MFKTSFVANVVDVLVVVEEKGLIIVVLLEGFIIAHKTEDRTNIYKKNIHIHITTHTNTHLQYPAATLYSHQCTVGEIESHIWSEAISWEYATH